MGDCETADVLTQDPEIRGQKYVCISFLSPEKLLHDREVFAFEQYTLRFRQEARTLLEDLKREFPDKAFVTSGMEERFTALLGDGPLIGDFRFFKTQNEERLLREFGEQNGFRTSVRGLKVRGSYESYEEARRRAESLRTTDPNHNVWVAQVGCWLPWDPSPDAVPAEYAESQLNTLMHTYMQQKEAADAAFEERTSGRALHSAMQGAEPWAADRML
jgi:hypothetical protein